MRNLKVREAALNMYFKDGKSYQFVAKALDVPLNTVKSWCLRYRKKMGISQRSKASRRKESVDIEYFGAAEPLC